MPALVADTHAIIWYLADDPPESGGRAVLIRALEPLAGIEGPTSGPGKLTRAMGITRRHNGADVTRGPLAVRSW